MNNDGNYVDESPDTLSEMSVNLYEQLKILARKQRSRAGRFVTYSTTELLHETCLRIGACDNRLGQISELFSYAAKTMRHLLTDAARRKLQPKRGGDLSRLDFDDSTVESLQTDSQLALELDAALGDLAKSDARAVRVVELHYFLGLDLEQVGEVLGIARRTVDRDWRYARSYLLAYMHSS